MMGPEIDVGALSQLASENLRVLLRKIPGTKDLIIDQGLMKPLDKFAAMSLIKSCGVDRVFRLERNSPDSLAPTRVYLMPPDLAVTKNVIEHISSRRSALGSSYHIVYVPRSLHQVEVLLEEEGLHGKVTIHEFAWEILPLDYDLLSLEFPSLFRQLFALEDASLLSAVPKSLAGIQALFGSIGSRLAVGRNSVNVLQQLELLEMLAPPTSKTLKGEISHLFVIDRNVDFATCLLSPLTYESLLDEVFTITCGQVELDGSQLDADMKEKMLIKLQLSSKDKMFEKIRNKHFASIFSSLSAYAKQLKQHQSRATTLSISEMKEFVQKNLKDIQTQSKAISMHIGAAEIIQKEKGPLYEMLLPMEREIVLGTGYKEPLTLLEDLMAQLYPIEIVLRLLALISLANQGILSADLDRIKTQFLQTFGFEHLITLDRMKQMGLIAVRESSIVAMPREKASANILPPFQAVAKKFGLVSKALPTGTGETSSGGPGYVFNGVYQPLACKIVQETMRPTNPKVGITDSLKEFQIPHKLITGSAAQSSKVVLVYFVGGYTLAEVAAFRLMQANFGMQFIIAGTSNISGKSLIKSILA